jgi:hypothetical protein
MAQKAVVCEEHILTKQGRPLGTFANSKQQGVSCGQQMGCTLQSFTFFKIQL